MCNFICFALCPVQTQPCFLPCQTHFTGAAPTTTSTPIPGECALTLIITFTLVILLALTFTLILTLALALTLTLTLACVRMFVEIVFVVVENACSFPFHLAFLLPTRAYI